MIGRDSDVEHSRRCARVDLFFNFNPGAKVRASTTVELSARSKTAGWELLLRAREETGGSTVIPTSRSRTYHDDISWPEPQWQPPQRTW